MKNENIKYPVSVQNLEEAGFLLDGSPAMAELLEKKFFGAYGATPYVDSFFNGREWQLGIFCRIEGRETRCQFSTEDDRWY